MLNKNIYVNANGVCIKFIDTLRGAAHCHCHGQVSSGLFCSFTGYGNGNRNEDGDKKGAQAMSQGQRGGECWFLALCRSFPFSQISLRLTLQRPMPRPVKPVQAYLSHKVLPYTRVLTRILWHPLCICVSIIFILMSKVSSVHAIYLQFQ